MQSIFFGTKQKSLISMPSTLEMHKLFNSRDVKILLKLVRQVAGLDLSIKKWKNKNKLKSCFQYY